MTLKQLSYVLFVGLAANVPGRAETPGRLILGFNAGAAASANDHARWGARGTGYGYLGEAGLQFTSWLAVPVFTVGYTYTNGNLPSWESAGYARYPTGLRTGANDYFVGGRVRVALWRMKLRPFAGAGAFWTEYHRHVNAKEYVLEDRAASGRGYAMTGGAEFFPNPASGFSLAVEYRYAAAAPEWRQPPAKNANFEPTFNFTEQLITVGVKLYTL